MLQSDSNQLAVKVQILDGSFLFNYTSENTMQTQYIGISLTNLIINKLGH